MGLIIPLPFTVKRKLFTFISESPIVAKLQYGMKVCATCLDNTEELATNWVADHIYLHSHPVHRQRQPCISRPDRTLRLQQRYSWSWVRYYSYLTSIIQSLLTNGSRLFTNSRAAIGSERMEVQARKFYSQRNMYLCGFTLFLSLILNRTYTFILDILRLEDKVKQYEGDKKAGGKDSAKLASAGEAGEIGRLRKELTDRERDIKVLKKQSEGLAREYSELSDKIGKENADDTPKKDR